MAYAHIHPIAQSEAKRRTLLANAADPRVTPIAATEVHCSTDGAGRVRFFRSNVNIGRTYYLGTVTSEAEMLALDAPVLARGACLPGDWCYRSDVRRWYRCLSGYGATLPDWEQLPQNITAADIADATAWGRARLADADASAAKTALAIAQSDVSGLVAALGSKAPLDSAALTGTPTAPTPTAANGIAIKSYVDSAVAAAGVPLWLRSSVQWWYGPESSPMGGDWSAAAAGADVYGWHDVSRHRRIGLSSGGSRPTYVADIGNGIGGIKSASGTSQRLEIALDSSASGLAGNRTIFAVVRRSSVTGYGFIFGSIENQRTSLFTGTDGGGEDLAVVLGSSAGVAASYTPTTELTLFEVRFRGTTLEFWVDGALLQTVTGYAPTLYSGAWTLKIGGYLPGVANQGCDVSIGHVSCLDGSASEAECNEVRAYLLDQWGL